MDTLLIQHDPEFDMAELEARLYSQIHHSTELWDEPVDQNILKNPFAQRSATQYSITNFSSNTNRYWATENSSIFSAKEITSNIDNEQNPVETLGNAPNRSMVPTLSDVISICGARNVPVGASSNKRAKKSKKSKNKYNKNVAYYDVNGKQLTKNQRKRHRQKMRAADLDPDFGLFATPRPIKTIAKDKLISNVNVIKENILDNGNVVTASENILDKGNVVVVTDSDSDSDSIIEVPVASPEIYTIPSSDEEELVFVQQSNKDNNDFNLNKQICVERNIDEPEVEIIEAPVNEEVETIATPVENTKDKEPVQSTSVIEKERTDLLCTPDSAANDFIEQDVRNMNRINFFNFNWHGDDLVIPGKEASKTITTAADVYETESSCSEAGPRNRPFFNEVDFESPAKEIFCEPNLTKFSNFITPLRSKAKPQNSEIITSNFSPISTKASTVSNSVNEDVSCSSDEFNSDSTVVQTTKKKNKKKKTQKKKREDQESDDNQQEGKEKRSRRKSKSDTESKSVGNEKKGKRKSASKSDSESNTEIIKRKKSKWQTETEVIEKMDDQTIIEQRPTKEKKSKGDKITEGFDLRINEQRPSKEKKVKKNSESDKTGEGSKRKKCKLQEQSNIIEKIVDIVECSINEKRLREKKTKKNSDSDQIQGSNEKKSKVHDQTEKLLNNAVEELINEPNQTIINEKGSVKDKELDDQTNIEQRITKEKISKGNKNTEGSDLSNETSEDIINEQRPTKEKAKKNFEPDISGEGSKQKKSKLQEQSNIIEKIVDKNSEPDKTGEDSKQKKSKSPDIIEHSRNEQRVREKKMKKTTVESLEENNTISTVINKRPVTAINSIEIVRSPKPTPQKEETEIICNSILSPTPTITELQDDRKYKKDNSTNNVKMFESPIRKVILSATKSPGNSSIDDPVAQYYKDTYFADDHLFISVIDKDKEFSFVKSYDKISQEKTKNQLCSPSTSKETVNSQTPIICCDSSDSDDVVIIENLGSVEENISADIVLNVKELEAKPIESSVPSVPAFSFVSNFKEIVKKKKTFSDFFTHDMNKFYNEPWEDDLPDVKEMQASMTNDVSKWKVINDDIFPKRRGPMCTKCRERGHIRQYCRKPRGPRKCVLCGKNGHDESRCPDSFCTSCRTQSRFPTTQCNQCQFYMRIRCSTCYFFGHQPKDCPDLWRRYHLTTTESSQLTVPEIYLKPMAHRWCSNCAQRGHLEDQCRRLRMSNYSINPQVVNYVPVYNTPVIPPPPEPNIPKLPDLRVTLSDLRNYKNDVMSNNNQKFITIIRRLQQMCSEGDEYRAERLRFLMRSANNNQFDRRQINELYQIRSKLNKSKKI